MNLLIIGGFLGSGKTTILLEMTKKIKSIYPSIVIIENEVGEIGIDGRYLQDEGLEVQELYSGCVCCTLASDLVSTLEKVNQVYKPDLVIVETSGVARPGDIVDCVRKYSPLVKTMKVLTVVDAIRYEVISKVLFPLLKEQIVAASFVVINKTFDFDEDSLKDIKETIRKLQPQANVFTEREIDFCYMLEVMF